MMQCQRETSYADICRPHADSTELLRDELFNIIFLVSRPLDDLCSLYLYFCVDHVSTEIAERQGTAM